MAVKQSKQTAQTKCGFVAIIGAPNAGKSTLLNRIIGEKISIVTHKPQTTRTRLRGVHVSGSTQVVFVDTPGIFEAKGRLEKAMVKAAWGALKEVDEIVFVIDSVRGLNPQVKEIFKRLKQDHRQVTLVFNKVDIIAREELLILTTEAMDTGVVRDVFMISAKTGDGVDGLLDYVAKRMPEGIWMYPEDQLTDMSERFLAAEETREALFKQLNQELPYQLTVITDKWEEFENGDLKLYQTVYVQKENHKRIILGKGGGKIKEIGTAARCALSEMFGRKVHLTLYVKVNSTWAEKAGFYQEMGLDFKV